MPNTNFKNIYFITLKFNSSFYITLIHHYVHAQKEQWARGEKIDFLYVRCSEWTLKANTITFLYDSNS